jgi:hypothetical protein
MAIVHNTTMNPTKLELLAAWLPAQPWFAGAGREPELTRVGGFRLDDPQGEVGIEFMLVADGSGDQPAVYQVPMTYHSRELPGAEGRLIGTSEHGGLGSMTASAIRSSWLSSWPSSKVRSKRKRRASATRRIPP